MTVRTTRRLALGLLLVAGLVGLAIAAGPLGPTKADNAARPAASSPPTTVEPAPTTSAETPTSSTAAVPDATAVPTGATPGTLIGSAPLPSSDGGTLFRITYVSQGAKNTPIVATGLVAFPSGAAPSGGWPLLSIGHPTVGSADVCAPSAAGGGGLAVAATLFTSAGYAVAMADYEGLGTDSPHPFLDGASAGRTVLDAARAARQLGVATSDELSLWGASQGGQAVLFAAQLAETWAPDLRLVATAAVAPVSELEELLSDVTQPRQGFAVLAAAGLGWAAGLDPNDILTPAAKPVLDLVETGCLEAIDAAVPEAELVRRDAAQNQAWRDFLAEQDAGRTAIPGSLLIVHGSADPIVPVADSEALAERYRALGAAVELTVEPGAGHADVVITSLRSTIEWLVAHR